MLSIWLTSIRDSQFTRKCYIFSSSYFYLICLPMYPKIGDFFRLVHFEFGLLCDILLTLTQDTLIMEIFLLVLNHIKFLIKWEVHQWVGYRVQSLANLHLDLTKDTHRSQVSDIFIQIVIIFIFTFIKNSQQTPKKAWFLKYTQF